MTHVAHEPGWLIRQVDKARAEMETWPQWMRDVARFEGSQGGCAGGSGRPCRAPYCSCSGEDQGADPELAKLLKAAASYKMSPREIWIQRVSFVYGQMMDSNPSVTIEDVERRAEETYGPCPED